jgi:hypothetical protein
VTNKHTGTIDQRGMCCACKSCCLSDHADANFAAYYSGTSDDGTSAMELNNILPQQGPQHAAGTCSVLHTLMLSLLLGCKNIAAINSGISIRD